MAIDERVRSGVEVHQADLATNGRVFAASSSSRQRPFQELARRLLLQALMIAGGATLQSLLALQLARLIDRLVEVGPPFGQSSRRTPVALRSL